MILLITWLCTLTLFDVYSWFIFMRLYELYCYLSVDDCVIVIFHGLYSCFILYWKDFVLVFKFIIKLLHILHYGRVFKYAKKNFKLIFENTYPFKGGWLGDHALYAQIENHFNMYMIGWSLCVIHLILIVFSIGITIDIYFLYSYLFLYM